MFGAPRAIGDAIRHEAAARGLVVQVAVAGTRMAALLLAFARPGLSVVPPGAEAATLASLPINVLLTLMAPGSHPRRAPTPTPRLGSPGPRLGVAAGADMFTAWGLKTLGELAALPPADLAARLGKTGRLWQAMARGDDVQPLVPEALEERFDASIDLEWPIEGLEPLSFVLTRLLEPLTTRLERRDRAVAVLHVRLDLVAAPSSGLEQDVVVRSLQLPMPVRDVRTLRTLVLLDLESRPLAAPIEGVALTVDPTPGKVLQHALFERAHPTPEQISTLLARLGALMGQDRLGAPATVDTDRPGAFTMKKFAPAAMRARGPADPGASIGVSSRRGVPSVIRRCRRPVPARVMLADDRPVRVTTDRQGFAGGAVRQAAGPWRASGDWWAGGAGRAGADAGEYRPHRVGCRARRWRRVSRFPGSDDGPVVYRGADGLKHDEHLALTHPAPSTRTRIPNRGLYRIAHRLGVQLPAGGVAARDDRRSCRRARLSRARAARSRRRLWRAAVLQGRAGRRHPTDRRRGADDWGGSRRRGIGRGRPPLGSARPVRIPGGVSQSLPADHAHEAGGAERRGRARARGSGRRHRRARGARGARGARRPPLRRRRTGRRARRPVRPRSGVRRAAAPRAARRGLRQPRAPGSGLGVPPADRGHRRRALRGSVGASALRRAHLHPPSHRSRARRPAAGAECGALSESARRDGGALRGSAGRGGADARAGRSPRLHDGGPRLPLSRLSGAGGRDAGLVSPEDCRGGRARALPAVSRSRARADCAGARSDREARAGRLFPDRLGSRELLPAAEHPRAGARLGGQQRRVLQPRHHGRGSGGHGPAVRALPLRGARGMARHRPRSAERRSARARHPVQCTKSMDGSARP